MFPFFTPWKHQKTKFPGVFKGYKMATLVRNGYLTWLVMARHFADSFSRNVFSDDRKASSLLIDTFEKLWKERAMIMCTSLLSFSGSGLWNWNFTQPASSFYGCCDAHSWCQYVGYIASTCPWRIRVFLNLQYFKCKLGRSPTRRYTCILRP